MTRVVTLTTDFGLGDYDCGVLAGVVWSIAPEARVVDLSHEISRHNILEAALLLERCMPYFPPGTIHVCVVDPGVGTERRGLAARFGDQWFVGPDNGLITLIHARAIAWDLPVELVFLSRKEYWLPKVSHIFHGRDIFAAVAGHLVDGAALNALGDPISDPILLNIPQPQRTLRGWQGVVMHIDAFGNLSTNLSKSDLDGADVSEVQIKEARIFGLVRAFGDAGQGELAALFDSSGKLSICEVNGDAAARLHARIGDTVEVIFE